MAVYHVAHHIYGAGNHYELGALVDEDSKQAFCVLYNLGASNPDPLAASVVVGSTFRDGKERQFFALGGFGFRRRILKTVICHADGEVCFVLRLSSPGMARRKDCLGSCQNDACERPVWRHLLQRSVLSAATATECCVSNIAKRQCQQSPHSRPLCKAQRKSGFRPSC